MITFASKKGPGAGEKVGSVSNVYLSAKNPTRRSNQLRILGAFYKREGVGRGGMLDLSLGD